MSRHPHQPDDTDSEGFFTRWSKRKKQAEPSHAEAKEEQIDADADDQKVEEPVKSDEDMPPLETIDGSSDVSEFFSPGVSEALRKAALRKMFHSPEFNIVDGLDDYDDNFTTFSALGDIVTADMRHQMELEKERQRAQQAGDQDAGELLEDSQEEPHSDGLNEQGSESDAKAGMDLEDDHGQSEAGETDQDPQSDNEEKPAA